MKILNKKLFRDVKNNKSQFVTIFLMVFLGVFVFAGIHAYMDGMKVSGDEYYEKNNLQDIWIQGENFTEEDLKQIKEIDNVKDAERMVTLRASLEEDKDIIFELNFIESNNISKMELIDGEKYSIDKDGIWVDYYYAQKKNLKVGDEVSLKFESYLIKEKIKGLIETPDHVYSIKDENAIFPTHEDFAYTYLSINEFPVEYIHDKMFKAFPIEEIDKSNLYVFPTVIVDVDNLDKLQETKAEIENKIESAKAVTDRDSCFSVKGYQSEVEEGETYSGVFTALFLFIAILSVVTTMRRFVKKQRMQIGTLKALGVKRRKIIIHYLNYGFYISFFASVLGIIVGDYILGGYFLEMEMSYFEVPSYHTVTIPLVYILAISVVVLITLVTFLSTIKVLKEPASEALRVEMPKVKKAKFTLTTKGIFKNASLSSRWNLRDIGRNKFRTFTAIVGITGCTMLIVCAFGMWDTLHSYLDWNFDVINNFDYKLSLDSNFTDEQLDNIINKYGDSTSKTYGIEYKKKDSDEKVVNTLIVNDSKGKLQYTDHNREPFKIKDDGIYITEKLSETTGFKVGDKISWHIFGDDTWYETKIVGLNRDPQSQILNMSRKAFENIGLEYKPDAVYTNEDLSDINEISGVETIQSIQNLRNGMESMLGMMKTLIIVLIVVSGILGMVIIYNLGVLSFSEKQYQFATLKVLGFKNKQIKKIFVQQNLWLTVVAIILGLPLGFYMVDVIFKQAIGDNYDFNAKIKLYSYLIAIIGTFIVSLITNKILAKKIKTIDMVTSLKGNE